MSTEYTATLERVLDGSTVEMNVNIGESQIEKRIIRIKGVQMENIMKQYRTGFKGAQGVKALFDTKQWFYERGGTYNIRVDTIDICGRWLSEIWKTVETDKLNTHLIGLGYKEVNWEQPKQEELKDDWFAGEQVTIPGGDELPIFQIWGKLVFLGPKSVNLRRLN